MQDLEGEKETTKKKTKGKKKAKRKRVDDGADDDEDEDAVRFEGVKDGGEGAVKKICPVCFQPLTVCLDVRGAEEDEEDPVSRTTSPVPNQNREGSISPLAKDENESHKAPCAICMDRPRDALLLRCGHMFTCVPCAKALPSKSCPICRAKIIKIVKVQRGTDGAAEGGRGGAASAGNIGNDTQRQTIMQRLATNEFSSSAKVDALLSAVAAMKRDEKGIVFSQYSSMIDIVEWALKRNGEKVVKLTGSMPQAQRKSVLNQFKKDKTIKIIILSLRAGGEGLNLQEATKVFVLEPWWNPQVEWQAIQRAHRIGQTRRVTAVRFIVEDTIEARMLQLQEKKQLVFDGTVDGSGDALGRLTEEDLRFLFHN
jgi:DNA repair protein RAD16